MKIKHLLIGLFAVAATVACKQDEPVETPSLEVSQESLELTATEAEASFDVTSNVAWTATADQDWVSLDPASGDASKKAVAVTVTAEDNTATEARTATVTVKAGDLTKTVALTQAAAEAEDPGEDPVVPEITELYMLGQACDTGWSLDQMTAFELVEGLWVWEGNLKPDNGEGDPEVFRFPLQKQSNVWWPCLVPNADATAVVYAEDDIENTYQVETDGYYKITVNPETLAMAIERLSDRQTVAPEVTELYVLGSGCDAGWTINNMTAFENNEGVFTWTGYLKPEEFRFPLQKVDNIWWPCYMISPDGQSLVLGRKDDDKVVYKVAYPAIYTVTIDFADASNPAFTIEPTETALSLVGTLAGDGNGWNKDSEAGKMTQENEYFVLKNANFVWRSSIWNDSADQNYFDFKLCNFGTWDAFGAALPGPHAANTAIDLTWGGVEIDVAAPEGEYDVYFDPAKCQIWFMTPGYKPGDGAPEVEQPEQPTITYVVAGTIEGDNWNNAGEKGRMTLEGDYYVAKDLPFLTSDAIYGDGKPIEFKVLHSGTWDCYGQVEAGNKSANTEIAVKWGGDNIAVAAPAGNYDVYFDKTNLKVWFMKAGYAPGDEVPEDEQPENPNFQVSELYMLGSGSEVGWNLGLITPFKLVDDVWVWEGNLYPNEPFRFQLAKDNQWAPSLTPSNDGKSVYRTEGQNSDYRVESAGFYKVTVNPLTGALDVEKLGDTRAKSLIYELFLIGNAVPAHGGEWKLQKDHPFTNVDGVFTWEGELVPGSIRPVPHVFDWQPTIQKKSDTELELVYGYSSSDIAIAEAGKYTLVINAKDSDNITYTLTKHEEPKPEPVLTLAENEASVAADATSYEVALTANCAWEATATEGVTVTPATGEGDATVTLTFAANEVTSPVTHSVTFSAGEGLTAVLTLTQAAAEPKALTVADFLAAEVDENVYYRLQGTITSVTNTSYGNFYLTDDTGTVLIYGLLSEDGATNKYWAASGAKLGDDIVVSVPRAVFNGTPQGKNAHFVELVSPGTRAFYTLSTEAVDFASAGGDQVVTVSAYNTDAAVTASSDNDKFAVSVNGYNVTITSEANEVEEKVSGNVTVKVGDLATKTVKVTLAAKPAEGVVEGGQDDFHTISSTSTSYVNGTTTAGWAYANCAIFKGGANNSSPAFVMIGDDANRALCMNGKTSAKGTITSPTFSTGCGTLKFNYGLPFGDNKIKFSVDIKQNGTVVKTFNVEKSSATQNTLYSHEEVINVSGDFQIVFTNLSPSNSTSNKDRTAVWDVEWTGYQE